MNRLIFHSKKPKKGRTRTIHEAETKRWVWNAIFIVTTVASDMLNVLALLIHDETCEHD